MRLTADLIKAAPAYVNPLKEREISFRGYKIPVLENLGVTEDQYESIDLSDNELLLLDNFPILNKLTTLLLSNNRICRIAPGLEQFLPKLTTLLLTNNKLASLKDIDPLATLPSLERLTLMGNPIAKLKNYRLYVIHKLPRVTLLDFRKVKPAERKESESIFGPAVDLAATKKSGGKKGDAKSGDAKSAAAAATAVGGAKTFTPGAGIPVTATGAAAPAAATLTTAASLTNEQRAKIMDKIRAASTMAEITALENMLKTGQLPQGF